MIRVHFVSFTGFTVHIVISWHFSPEPSHTVVNVISLMGSSSSNFRPYLTWWKFLWLSWNLSGVTIRLHVVPTHSHIMNSWLSYTLYDHTYFSPRTTLDISHSDMCGRIKKKLRCSCVIYRFVVILQRKTVRPTSKQMMKQTHFWFVYLFCFHS